MKSSRALSSLVLLIASLGAFSSCAMHPCGKSNGRQDPSGFVFRALKGKDHVYRVAVTRPAGAPILVLHGLGGLDGPTLDWSKDLSRHGWKVYMPMLDGEFDECDPSAHLVRLQLSPRWKLHDPNDAGPVLEDMGLLADQISALHGGRPLVAAGNCLTGSFPLALLSRPSVKTAVLCQPALPVKSALQVLLQLPQSRDKRRGLAIPREQLNKSLTALHNPGKRLYGFHYLQDPLASMDKFYSLHEALQRQGIAGKFKPVVLVPVGSDVRESWWITRKTSLKQGRITPHVTVTGGEEVDRTRLRKMFNEVIRP